MRELAGVGRLLARDHAEERGLARAVRTDHADDAAGRKRERELLEQQPVAVGLGDVARLDDDVAEPRAGRDVDLDAVELDVLPPRRGAARRGEAGLALGVPRPGRHPHPLELAGQRPLPRPIPASPRPRAEPASARATTSSCPPTGCRGRGRARGSSRPRCRGSSGRGSPRRRCRGTPRGTARARRPTRRRGGSSARRAAGGRAMESSTRHSATRRRSPPESVVTSASAGGQRRASIADLEHAVEVPGVGALDPVLHLALLVEKRGPSRRLTSARRTGR